MGLFTRLFDHEYKELKKFESLADKIVALDEDYQKLSDEELKNKTEEFKKRLANGETLEPKYKDHALIDTKYYKNCRECHIEPDWLLVYKYNNDEIILYLVETGSHSDLFNM